MNSAGPPQFSRADRDAERRRVLDELRSDPCRLIDTLMEFNSYVGTVAISIEMEERRIREGEFSEAQLDMLIVTGLLRNLLDAAEGLQRIGVATDRAVQDFMSVGGGAKNARDVLVHRSDYILGTGNLQIDARLEGLAQSGETPDTDLHYFFQRGLPGDSTIIMEIGQDISVPLGEAIPAAINLAEQLLELIDTEIERLRNA